MRRRDLTILSGLLWFLLGGVAVAETPPAKVVQQFIESTLQGRFAEARSFALGQVNVSDSLFSNWLFGSGGAGGDAGTSDVFLSRKFTQVFRYNITGTNPTGENQAQVTVMRTSPNLTHMYTWALAPKYGAAPYELIEAIDTYLTTVNFPIEDSSMQFTLIREAGEWYISAIYDEKFAQLQQLGLAQQPLSAAVPSPSSGAAAPVPGGPSAAPPAAPATSPAASGNVGRQLADAQFNATLQSFNRHYQSQAQPGPPEAQEHDNNPSFLGRVAKLFGLGGKGETMVQVTNSNLQQTLRGVRDALVRYAVANNGQVPDDVQIHDWQSLRRMVNRYGKQPLPATEAEAGFNFMRYDAAPTRDDYILLLELHEPQDGVERVEVTPYGVDRAG